MSSMKNLMESLNRIVESEGWVLMVELPDGKKRVEGTYQSQNDANEVGVDGVDAGEFADFWIEKKNFTESEDDVVETEISLTEDEDAVVELENIAEEMMLLCEQAMRIVRGLDRGQYGPIEDRARMYWYGHIMSAIGNNDIPSRSYSLMDTVREIAGEEEEEY